jgi:hypothetical protein
MQLTIQLVLAFLTIFGGLLFIALSQQAHFCNRRWAARCNAIGLRTVAARRMAGIFSLLLGAATLVMSEGIGFGLVLWVMATGALAAVLAWVLARAN